MIEENKYAFYGSMKLPDDPLHSIAGFFSVSDVRVTSAKYVDKRGMSNELVSGTFSGYDADDMFSLRMVYDTPKGIDETIDIIVRKLPRNDLYVGDFSLNIKPTKITGEVSLRIKKIEDNKE